MTNTYDALLPRSNLSLLAPSSQLLASTTYGYDAASRLQTVSTLDLGLGTLNTATYSYLANSPLVSQIAFTNGTTRRMTTTKSYDCYVLKQFCVQSSLVAWRGFFGSHESRG